MKKIYVFKCSEFPNKMDRLHSNKRRAKLEARKHVKIYGDSGDNLIVSYEIDGLITPASESLLVSGRWVELSN